MLVLARKSNESLVIDGQIRVTVVEVRGNQVRLGIEAPADISVFRQELLEKRPQTEEPTPRIRLFAATVPE
jgi:carbon storage regulator